MGPWIVLPVFNEAASVGGVVRRARRHGPVLVVDDGSTDDTAGAAREAGAEVLRHDRRRGKGVAILAGAARAMAHGASGILTLDGDGQHDAAEIPLLLGAARPAGRFIVIGGRLRGARAIPPGRRNAHAVAGFFVNWLTGTDVRDTQSGFRLYPAEVFREVPLRRGGFVLETEILLAAGRAGFGLREVPVTAIYHAGRRSRFRPVRDGCAVGAFLARHVLARLGSEGWHLVRRVARGLSPGVARRRHADLARETLAYRGTPAQWGLAAGAFALRRLAATLHGWWNDPRPRQLRLIGAGAAAFPVLGLLALLHPVATRCSLDFLTPFVRRFYSQERLAGTRMPAPAPATGWGQREAREGAAGDAAMATDRPT